MSRIASIAIAFSLLVGLAPPTASANETEEIYTVIRNKGAAANDAFSAGDFETASREYAAVEGLLETIDGRKKELAIVRFNLGRCFDELGQPVKAIEAYRRSITGPIDPKLAGPIKERIATLEAESMGTIIVNCEVPDAQIRVAGHDTEGPCGYRFVIAPGPHVVVGTTPGGVEQRAGVEVVSGRVHQVALFAPEPAGSINIPAWSLSAGALAALGVGIAFNIDARDSIEEGSRLEALYLENEDPATREAMIEADDEAESKAAVSYVLFGVGGALAAGAVYFFIAEPGDDQTAWMPVVGPSGVGVVGTF